MPRVSVVIPIYAAERTIAATLRSALGQRFTDFEVLIVNDGSPDGSAAICRSFSDPRVQIIDQQNRGLAGARNTGIRCARGEYIALLDGDDLWLPDKLDRQVRHLDEHPAVGVSYCQAALIDGRGRSLELLQVPKLAGITALDMLCNNPIKNGSCPLIRRQVFDDLRFFVAGVPCYFDESFRCLEDIECWLRILLTTSWQLGGIPDVLVCYRISEGTLSSHHRPMHEAMRQLLAKLRTYASPGFAQGWEAAAMGYFLRHLAQGAVLRAEGRGLALRFMAQALLRHPGMLLQDPEKTLLTLAGAGVQAVLPGRVHARLLPWALRAAGAIQRRGALRDR